jgi:hypothetical protein
MDYWGPITTQYGWGTVRKGRRTQAEVYHADPSDEPGTKLRFNLYEGTEPEEFSVRKNQKGQWFLHNKTQTREKRPDIPSEKPTYKEIDPDDVDPTDDQQAMMPKLDGAHGVIDLKAGRSPRVYSYRVGKKTKTGLIEHTHKMPNLLKDKVPKELDNTIIRGEILGVKDGKAIPAERTGGILNTKVWDSRRKQAREGRLKMFPFDVVKHRGRDMSKAPYEEKREILELVDKYITDVELPELMTEPKDKISLLNLIRSKKYPLTEEGVVLVSPKREASPIKAKFAPDFDIYTRDIHPAISGKTGKPHDRAGAISYSWTPDGPIVGQVGGFKHVEGRDMLRDPDKYIGRVAKVKATKVFEGENGELGALFQPRFKEWHLDKGDIEKQAFFDELQKIAGVWGDARSWVQKHPAMTAAGVGTLAAGGILGRHLAKRITPAATRIGRRLQTVAQREGIRPVIRTRATSIRQTPTLLERLKGRIQAGGQRPIYTTQEGFPLAGQRTRKGVTVGLDPDVASRAEIHMGGGMTRGAKARRLHRAAREIEIGGKVKEVSPEVGVGRAFAKSHSAQDITRAHKIRKPGGTLKSQTRYLEQLQKAMKTEYGRKGFVMKPHGEVSSAGAFPTHKDNWGKLYKDYITRLKPEMEALKRDVIKNPGKYPPGAHWQNIVANRFRKDPAYVGSALEGVLKDPKRTLSQEMMKVVKYRGGKPAEFRVHAIGGEVPTELAYERYSPTREFLRRIPGVRSLLGRKTYGSPQEAAEWARREVIPKLKKKYRGATFGLDVIRVKKPGGGYGYKLVELNPSTIEGTSGFLDPQINPAVSSDIRRWLVGRDIPAIAAAKTLAAGGGAAGATALGLQQLSKQPTGKTRA